MLQDLFTLGVIKSATDFQVYKEVAGLSGLDFAYVDNTAVYHTKVSFSLYVLRNIWFAFWFCILLQIMNFIVLVEKILQRNLYESSSCHNNSLLSFKWIWSNWT